VLTITIKLNLIKE